MRIVSQSQLNKAEKQQVLNLWNNEYPEKLAYKNAEEFEEYLNHLTEQHHYLLKDETENIQGWAFTFKRADEKWFAIMISGELQGKGTGTQILNQLKENESELNGWVIDHDDDKKLNGDAYRSPLAFYEKNGFEIISAIRLELETLSAVKIKWQRRN
ncbi:GNAT family N-acetyltransferase [Pedobacter montanisoli]|uniref:GNAT family N-acetyltransferase n=1 Tax=Pedobacter montanisoli TaxID=2923277 RepID=A0ABS9ZR42_9SPHI|nr:GNAT family N-acetyltransferase [Pedobacter montanisoli]MCJ0741071.1 GNAT family N-acetyltransferase [Pedobacter montanisoli]